MINLLPDDVKYDLRAARMNVMLLRYILFTGVVVALIIGMCLAFYLYLSTTHASALTTSSTNNDKAKEFTEVRKAADDYRNNLSIAKKILDNSVDYTTVVLAITELLPSGVVLDSINLTADSFGQQTSFSAHAKTYDKAIELKERFEESDVFSNVFFQSLTDSDGSSEGGSSAYPIAVTISATLENVMESKQ